MTTAAHSALSDVPASAWSQLAARRIFFGHQSVGYNIMAGVDSVLSSHPEIALNVVESAPTASAGFYHAKVGRNTAPQSKQDEFAGIVERTPWPDGGVAMVKLCYVDVHAGTDPKSLFAAYRQKMEDLSARRPQVTLVHFTLPLTAARRSFSHWKNRLLGRATHEDVNAIRNRYNELLLEAYSNREPVFDLAQLESTRPDGSRSFLERGSERVYTLTREYTDDGGHLNTAAQRFVAERFLVFLAGLAPSR